MSDMDINNLASDELQPLMISIEKLLKYRIEQDPMFEKLFELYREYEKATVSPQIFEATLPCTITFYMDNYEPSGVYISATCKIAGYENFCEECPEIDVAVSKSIENKIEFQKLLTEFKTKYNVNKDTIKDFLWDKYSEPNKNQSELNQTNED